MNCWRTRPDWRPWARRPARRVLAEHLYAHRARTVLDRVVSFPAVCRERPPWRSGGVRNATEDIRNVTEGVPYSTPRRPTKAKQQPLRLLLVVHGVRGQRPWGGTELHVDQLCRALGHKYDIHLLYTSPHRAGRSMIHRHPGTGRQRACSTRVPTMPSGRGSIRSATLPFGSCWSKKRSTSCISSTSFSIPSVMWKRPGRWGGPRVLGLYDFFLACPQYNLLDHSGRFCNLPAIGTCDHAWPVWTACPPAPKAGGANC